VKTFFKFDRQWHARVLLSNTMNGFPPSLVHNSVVGLSVVMLLICLEYAETSVIELL